MELGAEPEADSIAQGNLFIAETYSKKLALIAAALLVDPPTPTRL